jgi:hypothetical protein
MPKLTDNVPTCDRDLSDEEQATSDYLHALHEAGHAIVGKHVGHEVYHVHIGDDGGFCDGGYVDTGARSRMSRALVTLGGQLAVAMFGQGMGFDVNNWDNAADDLRKFEEARGGMTFRHARKKVQAILRAKEAELKALARRVAEEGDVYIDQHPSEYAEFVIALPETDA